MGYYRQQEFDFIERTKSILEQYDSFQIPKKERYEITLFLNCLTGLLVLPQQKWNEFLPTDIINEKEWGIKPNHISVIKDKKLNDEDKSIKNVVKHLRNAISHYKFTAFSNSNEEIKSIKFEDFTPKKEKTFEAEIPVSALRKFIDKFIFVMIEEMKK